MVYRVIGLMSGTSLDGLDIACCRIEKTSNGWSYQIETAETSEFPEALSAKIQAAMTMSGLDLIQLDRELGRWIGSEVKGFILRHDLAVDFIGSHGHTIFHEPDKGITYQIGYIPEIAAACGLPVIGDFRGMDVALGGQGAPLVPIGDQLLFSDMDYCLNLGGIANVSYSSGTERIAFDICPANMALNRLSQEVGHAYDEDGKLAASGKLNSTLLSKLNALEYYEQPYPKSLGYEWVSAHVFPLIDNKDIPLADRLHTVCVHIAQQIGRIRGLGDHTSQRMLCTGGGSFNNFLISRIRHHTGIHVITPEALIIGYKEALVFAFLAVLRWRGEANCLSTVTGARSNSSGGMISPLLST